jgi:hypothetical protein
MTCPASRLQDHNGVAVSADGKVAFSDETVKVWDVETGTGLATFSVDGEAFCSALGHDVIARWCLVRARLLPGAGAGRGRSSRARADKLKHVLPASGNRL